MSLINYQWVGHIHHGRFVQVHSKFNETHSGLGHML
jgi:hypothetical protein